MKYAVWTLGSSRKGPYYPKIVDAVSFEDAIYRYSIERQHDAAWTGTFVVAQIAEVVEVTRKRVYEYETIIRPHPDPDC